MWKTRDGISPYRHSSPLRTGAALHNHPIRRVTRSPSPVPGPTGCNPARPLRSRRCRRTEPRVASQARSGTSGFEWNRMRCSNPCGTGRRPPDSVIRISPGSPTLRSATRMDTHVIGTGVVVLQVGDAGLSCSTSERSSDSRASCQIAACSAPSVSCRTRLADRRTTYRYRPQVRPGRERSHDDQPDIDGPVRQVGAPFGGRSRAPRATRTILTGRDSPLWLPVG